MSISLTMIVRDEADTLPITMPTYLPLIDSWTILDTGSTDGTPDLVEELLGHVPGRLYREEWPSGAQFDYGAARTRALELARGRTEWIFMPDADMECEADPGLREWLFRDPDPAVAAWDVRVVDHGTKWWSTRLFRGAQRWEYKGKRHELPDTKGRKRRNLLSVTLKHDSSGPTNGKYDEYAEALRADAEMGEPRAVFYYAESLRFAGHTDQAVEWYRKRAAISAGYDEEQWYSAYMVGKLTSDVAALIEAWEDRPWRHEPLTAAARLVASQGSDRDMLFLEAAP